MLRHEKFSIIVQNVVNGWIVNYSGVSVQEKVMPFAAPVNHFAVEQFGKMGNVTYRMVFHQDVYVVICGGLKYLGNVERSCKVVGAFWFDVQVRRHSLFQLFQIACNHRAA